MVSLHWGWLLFIIVALLIVGLLAGYFGARILFKRELKKNPPINEKMIRVMFTQMGRKPSEKQVKQVMRSMEEANK